jgi:hypothetical protein
VEVERALLFPPRHQDLSLQPLLELLVEESILLQVVYFEEVVDQVEQSFFADAAHFHAHLVKFAQTDPQYTHFAMSSRLRSVKYRFWGICES